MSYYAVYVFDEPKPPEDGDDLASGTGWLGWGAYVLDRADEYPECAHLAAEGWSDRPDDLEHEAEKLTHADEPDVAAVSARLLAVVKAAPEGAVGILVTDGTEPDGDEEDGDEGDEG